MPDQVEFILKKIHVLFAKCEPYQASPDQVIISKKEVFQILEELNVAIYDVLDQYEATTRSKEKARLLVERTASEIMVGARKNAEDMNAASLMYTDSMLDEVKAVVDDANDDLKRVFRKLEEEIKDRLDFLSQNKEEVKQQLGELHEGERYLKVLKQQRELEEETALSETFEEEDEKEVEEGSEEDQPKKAEFVVKVHNQRAEVKPNRKPKISKEEKKKKLEELLLGESRQDVPVEPTEIELTEPLFHAEDFNLDAEYEAWKEVPDGVLEDKSAKKEKWSLFGKKK